MSTYLIPKQSSSQELRRVHRMPWLATAPCPWPKDTHSRVVIPLNAEELRNSKPGNPLCHIQIVADNRLVDINQLPVINHA